MNGRTEDVRQRAESKLEKSQKAHRESDKAWAQHEAESKAIRAKTERLKSLRLAKEAADLELAAQQVVVVKKPRATRKKPVTA